MSPNLKPIKLYSIFILAIILIAVYGFYENESNQTLPTTSQLTDLSTTVVRDSFKEFNDKQQGGPIQPTHIINGNSTATIKVGTDPFKAYLETQSRVKPQEAAISPFSEGK